MKLNEIVLRYLKGQKKHTVLTVLAIIVSVAFMTIILSAVSVYRAASLNISRETNGTYHIVFNGLDKQQLIDIRSMDILKKLRYTAFPPIRAALIWTSLKWRRTTQRWNICW